MSYVVVLFRYCMLSHCIIGNCSIPTCIYKDANYCWSWVHAALRQQRWRHLGPLVTSPSWNPVTALEYYQYEFCLFSVPYPHTRWHKNTALDTLYTNTSPPYFPSGVIEPTIVKAVYSLSISISRFSPPSNPEIMWVVPFNGHYANPSLQLCSRTCSWCYFFY